MSENQSFILHNWITIPGNAEFPLIQHALKTTVETVVTLLQLDDVLMLPADTTFEPRLNIELDRVLLSLYAITFPSQNQKWQAPHPARL